ncbi:MAG: type VI secretion system Vgr family protein [Marivita sp.]|uniref:type VI secretion system Vgr family protein n=1 Tax=Marivita sp. TaxID=2003365 RepID=UPI003EF4BF5D
MPDQNSILVTLTVDGNTDYDVQSYDFEEVLSDVPTYKVTILDQASKMTALLGKPCTIALTKEVYADAKPRAFAGLVMSVERTVSENGSPVLDLVIRPPMAVLGLSVSNAVYEKKTALDILQVVLERNNLKKLTVSGSKPTVKRDLVIQYNENDLDFVRRILAEEGLTFYFNDGSSADKLVLHDTQKPFPSDVKDILLTDAELSDVERMEAHILTLRHRARPSKVELLTYDPDKADKAVASGTVQLDVKLSETPELLEFRPMTVPAGTVTGTELSVASDAARRDEFGLSGSCEHPGMYLGQTINVASSGHDEIAGDYVIVGMRYRPVRGNALVCSFDAIPTSHKAVPARLPKPMIAGVHNAIVIGGDGDKAGMPSCDAEGRVHVRFFWDKEGNNTVWLRVSEPYAGKGYGAQFIPRVGHEVLVSFLHGDPDAPIITGQIYNAKNKPPFIEKNTTRSGIRSQLEGEPNEWEFDDKKDHELIAVRAARDYNLIVNNDVVRDIKKFETTTIGETCTLDVKKDFVTTVVNTIEASAKTRTAEIETDDKVTAKTITLEASSKLTLKVGGSTIEMTPSAITISTSTFKAEGSSKADLKSSGTATVDGMNVNVKAKTTAAVQGLTVDLKASSMLSAQGPICDVKGTGTLTMQGGICMIN